ncbi:MAG: hypothetical protein HWE20_09565 [Gammaproteobacteria bacterium]|nr:hypothetical protein [Gammaproteobacteria bacterium]
MHLFAWIILANTLIISLTQSGLGIVLPAGVLGSLVLVYAAAWWLIDVRREFKLPPTESQITRAVLRRLQQDFTSLNSRGTEPSQSTRYWSYLAIALALVTVTLNLVNIFSTETSSSSLVQSLTQSIVVGLIVLWMTANARQEFATRKKAKAWLFHYRAIAIDRACQFYREVVWARAQYTHEDKLIDFAHVVPVINDNQGYWVNVKEYMLEPNAHEHTPRRQNALRTEPTQAYEEEKIADINDVSLVMFGPERSMLIPDPKSAMRIDTTRSTINCLLTMEEQTSIWKTIRFLLLHRRSEQSYWPEVVAGIDNWLEANTWLSDWVRLRLGSRASYLFSNSLHPEDFLEDIPKGVRTESLDHPHIIVKWVADPLLHEVFYQHVSRTSYSDKKFKLMFADQELILDLNLKNTQDRPYARALLNALNERIESFRSQAPSRQQIGPMN